MTLNEDLNTFLSSLSNSELATFIAYRFDDFLDNSKQKIIKEVKKRNLSITDLKHLYEKGITDNNTDLNSACPNCGSSKFILETDFELRQKNYGSYEVAVESNRCRICGFNPAKSKQKGLFKKIKQKLGFYRETRLKRPEIDGQMFT